MQVPYEKANVPIASCTYATAHSAGWTWDIGLHQRRGIGYVYSSDHCSDDQALQTLQNYIGPAAQGLSARKLSFEAGFREVQWHKNCVAIGLSAGFIEPLEATGISFAEVAALILSSVFPWSGDYELPAKQFNKQMTTRYKHVVDFIKLHYCLSKRTDTDFWRDNCAQSSISDGLKEKLEIWRHRPPSFIDVDSDHDIFDENSWQYILYGMGFQTNMQARAGALRYYEGAQQEFESIRMQCENAAATMPTHRDLVSQVAANGFVKATGAAR